MTRYPHFKRDAILFLVFAIGMFAILTWSMYQFGQEVKADEPPGGLCLWDFKLNVWQLNGVKVRCESLVEPCGEPYFTIVVIWYNNVMEPIGQDSVENVMLDQEVSFEIPPNNPSWVKVEAFGVCSLCGSRKYHYEVKHLLYSGMPCDREVDIPEKL